MIRSQSQTRPDISNAFYFISIGFLYVEIFIKYTTSEKHVNSFVSHCTCVGNQIRQSQKEPFSTASGPSLVSAHHGLSIHSYPYDMVGPTLGPMRMCGVNESQV